jgi:DNA/RNA-binding domain of Phe-tRNA-synthetase-like protein
VLGPGADRARRVPTADHPLVDRYNAVSMRWAVPVDFDRVAPPVQLRFASGDEPFDRA